MPRMRLVDVPREPEPELEPFEGSRAEPATPAQAAPLEDEVPEHERCRAGGRHDWVSTHESGGIELLGCRNCPATKPRVGFAGGSPGYVFGRTPGEGGGF